MEYVMKISAVWITKNEEKNILNSINSVINAVDELIIVDTGSIDRTCSIAQEAGARIEYFEWINDFSAARNYALSLASGDIIIFLDADEWFSPAITQKDRKEIASMFEENAHLDVIQPFLFHFNSMGKFIHIAPNSRIFRNNPEFCFHGAIHEIYLTKSGMAPTAFLANQWQIHHSGYTEEHISDKHSRNIAMLEEVINNEKCPEKKHLYSCYIVRELSNNNQHEKALVYLNKVLSEASYLAKHFSFLGYNFSSFIYSMLNTAIVMRAKVSRREIRNKIIDCFKLNLSQYPGAATIDLFFEINFDLDEARLLKKIDSSLRASKRNQQNYDTSFLEREAAVCFKAAQAALIRGNYKTAMEYAYEAHQRSSHLSLQALTIIVSSMREISFANPIAFFNSLFDINDPNILKLLTTASFKQDFKEVYLYYLDLCVKKGAGTVWDFAFLILLSLGCKDAVTAAKKNYNEANADVVAKTIMLSAILTNDVKLFEENRDILTEYEDVLKAYFNGKPLAVMHWNHFAALMEIYPLIAFAADVERADAFAAAFPQQDKRVYIRRLSYCLENGLFEHALSNDLPDKNDKPSNYMVLQAMIRLGRLDGAFSLIKGQLELGNADEQFLQYLAVISEKASGSLKKSACSLYEEYISVYNKFVDLRDMLTTGYLIYNKSNHKENSLKELTYEQFQKQFSIDKRAPRFASLYSISIGAAAIYEEKSMFLMALECLILAHQCYENRERTYQDMARLFEKIGNLTLSGALAEKSKSPQLL